MLCIKRLPPPHHGSECHHDRLNRDSGRLNWIDWAKAIGIFMVVTGHSHHNNADVIPLIFMIHMPLFFVISGYLFKTECTLKELTIKSIRGLLIPYILYNIIVAIYWLSLGGIEYALGRAFEWDKCIIAPTINTIMGQPVGSFDGPTWFLLALIWCKYFGWALHRGNVYVKILTIAMWATLFFLRDESPCFLFYSLKCGLAGFIWFEIGYVIKRYSKMPKLPKWALAMCIVVGAAVCYIICTRHGSCNYILAKTNGIIGIIGTGAGLIAFFSMCKMLNGISSEIVIKVSKASILVMCLHMPLQSFIENFTHYQGSEIVTFIVDLVIVLALTAIYPFIKKHAPILLGGR